MFDKAWRENPANCKEEHIFSKYSLVYWGEKECINYDLQFSSFIYFLKQITSENVHIFY